MELVRKIRQTEERAREIVEQAKAIAVKQAEEGLNSRNRLLGEAEKERKKTVESAIAESKSQGLKEAEVLRAQAKKDIQKLRRETADKMASAVEKVMDFFRG